MSEKSVIGHIVDLGLLDDCKTCVEKDARIARLEFAMKFLNAHGSWCCHHWLIGADLRTACPWCRGSVSRHEKISIDDPKAHEPSCMYKTSIELLRGVS